MRYKNVTEGVLKFRAHDKDGKKRVFELESGKEMESDRLVSLAGLEQVKQNKVKKLREVQ